MTRKDLIISCFIINIFIFIFIPAHAESIVTNEKSPAVTYAGSGKTSEANVFPGKGDALPSVNSAGLNKIPDSIVSLSSGYVVVVDKKNQKIYVFHKAETFTKVFEAPCSTGKNPGSKQVAGDAKTPDGIFFATKILHNPGPPEIYGSMAFPLDYPTLIDKRAGKDGNNIWIHGTTKSLLPKQSNGCVVLRDNDLKRLANFIYLNRTPVIISESIKWVPQNFVSPDKSDLEKILISWNEAFTGKDIRKIDSLYMKGSEIKGKRREDLHNKIRNLKYINKHFVLQPRDVSILQEKHNAVIVFDQIFAVNDNNSFQGFYNKLILEKFNNKWFVVDDATTAGVSGKHLASAINNQQESNTADNVIQKEIKDFLKRWLTSWESGNLEVYRGCYAPDFKAKEMDLDAWVSHKSNVRQKSSDITIRIDNLQITSHGETARAFFVQHYSSSILKSKGKKTLELRKSGGEWKIYREIL